MSMASIGREVVGVGERSRGPALQEVELMELELAWDAVTIIFLEKALQVAEQADKSTLELVQVNPQPWRERSFKVMNEWLAQKSRYMHELRTETKGGVRTVTLWVYLRVRRSVNISMHLN
jgi:hypothetical protein